MYHISKCECVCAHVCVHRQIVTHDSQVMQQIVRCGFWNLSYYMKTSACTYVTPICI